MHPPEGGDGPITATSPLALALLGFDGVSAALIAGGGIVYTTTQGASHGVEYTAQIAPFGSVLPTSLQGVWDPSLRLFAPIDPPADTSELAGFVYTASGVGFGRQPLDGRTGSVTISNTVPGNHFAMAFAVATNGPGGIGSACFASDPNSVNYYCWSGPPANEVYSISNASLSGFATDGARLFIRNVIGTTTNEIVTVPVAAANPTATPYIAVSGALGDLHFGAGHILGSIVTPSGQMPQIWLWDTNVGTLLAQLQQPAPPKQFVFYGKSIFALMGDGTIYVYPQLGLPVLVAMGQGGATLLGAVKGPAGQAVLYFADANRIGGAAVSYIEVTGNLF
jgi:hypothetical protein